MYKNGFWDSFFKGKRVFRIISMVLVESLIFSSIVWADQGAMLNSDDLKIPKKFGSVKERFESEGENALVIHIQDTHTSYSAQKHLSKILKYLSDNYGIDVVGIEGATDSIDTSDFSKFPDKSVKDKVAEYFLKEGKIDGAEYLCIVENSGDGQELIKLQGIESGGLYKSNLDAFLRSLPYQSELVFFCDVMNDNIEKIKKHIYSKSLLEYDVAVRAFKENKVNFVSHCQQLKEFSEENLVEFDKMPNLEKLFSLIELESKINFPRVDVERYVAVRRISDKLPESESTDLLSKEFSFRTKKISSEEYHFYLKNLFAKHNFSLDEFTHLKNYMEYLSDFAAMEHNLALAESVVQEEKIYEALLQNDNQRELYEISRYIDLMSKFSRLQMTRKYIHKYHDYRSRYKLEKVVSYLKDEAKKYGEDLTINFDLSMVNTNLENFEEFYKLAGLREQKMVQNAISLMKKEHKKAIVLIAGGFHTKGITEVLQKEKVSYVVVTPNMDNDKNPIPYISLLKNLRTPLEQMIATHTSTLKVASWLTSGEPLAYKANKTIMASKMKMLLSTTKLYDLYMGMLVQYSPEERVLIQQKLQDHLKNTINKVISSVGYDDVLVVDSVDLNFKHDISTKQDLIAKIRFKNSNTLYVKYSDSIKASKDAEDGFLELVRLQDGIATEFMGSLGYVKVTSDYKFLVSQIISTIFDTPKTIKDITAKLNKNKTGTVLKEEDVALYMDSLVNLGLVGSKNEQFYVIGEELSEGKIVKITPYLIKTLTAKMSASENGKLGLAILKIEDIPENYKNVFSRLNVDRLLVDPTISITDIRDFVHKLMELNKNMPLYPEGPVSLPLKIDISEKVQINTSYTISEDGGFKYSFHLMLKPSVTGKVDFDKAIEDEVGFENIRINNKLSKNPLERRYLDELKKIKNKFGGDISTNLLSDGEKEALIDYICNRLGRKPAEGSALYSALRRYMGIHRSVTPFYSKRVGVVLLGGQFDSEFKNTFLLLTKLSPSIELTSDIEDKIVSSLVGIQLNKEKGLRTEIDWFNLLLYVFKNAPSSIRTSKLNKNLINVLKLIKKRSVESGGFLDASEINKIVNNQILLAEIGKTAISGVLLSDLGKRTEILDKMMVSGKETVFEGDQKSARLTIVLKNADGTYLALDKNSGFGYKVFPLPYDTKLNEFKFRNLRDDLQRGFNDRAGFYIQRVPVDKVFPDADEANVRYLSGLIKKRREVVDSRSSGNIEARLDEVMKMPTKVEKSIMASVNVFAGEIKESKRLALEDIDSYTWKIREIENQEEILSFLQTELEKLQKNKKLDVVRLRAHNATLEKLTANRDSVAFFRNNTLNSVVGKVVTGKMLLILREYLQIGRKQKPIDNVLHSWFSTQSIIGNNKMLLRGLDIKKVLSWKDGKGVMVAEHLLDVLKPIIGVSEAKSVIKNMLDDSSNQKIKTSIVDNFESAYHVFNNLSNLIVSTPVDSVGKDVKKRIDNMDSLMRRSLDSAVLERSLAGNVANLKTLETNIFEEKQAIRKVRSKINFSYPKKETQLLDDIVLTQNNIKDYKKDKDSLLERVTALKQNLRYTTFLGKAIEVLKKRIANGESSVRIEKKVIPIIPDNIPLIVSYIAHEFVGAECVAIEKRAKTYKERELAEQLFEISFTGYYQKMKDSSERDIPFKEITDQFQGNILIYGEDTYNSFNLFHNKTDNYELNTLIDRSLALVQKLDPAVYDYIKGKGRIVVASQPFLPSTGAGLSALQNISAKEQTVYIEKAVFGDIVKLFKTNPREAVKLMAASIEASAQGVIQQQESIINLNKANVFEIHAFIVNRFKQELPEEKISPRLQDIFTKTAATIYKSRVKQGGFNRRENITSLKRDLDAIHKSLWPLIGQYVKFLDYKPETAHNIGLKLASRILGADYKTYRNSLKQEWSVYRDTIAKTTDRKAHMFSSKADYQTSVFSSKSLSVHDKYKVFFSRTFGFDHIFDYISAKVSDFNTKSPMIDYLNLVADLNLSLNALLNVANYRFENKFQNGKVMVLVTTPSGEKALITQEAKDEFIQALKDYSNSLKFYYRHGEGVGLLFTDETQKVRELPVLFGAFDTAKVNNGILAQARLRDGLNTKIQTPFANDIRAIMNIDSILASDDASAVDRKFKDRKLAESLRTQFELFIRTLDNPLSDSEKKSLSALYLSHNSDLSSVDANLISYVSGVDNGDVPVVVNKKITDLLLGLIKWRPTEQFGYAKTQLLDLTLHNNWKQFSPSVRKAIFETVTDRYTLSAGERRMLADLFKKVDRNAYVAQTTGLTSSAISFMWEIEKQVLAVSNDPEFIKETFDFYINLTDISKEAFLETQKTSDEEWGDAEDLDIKEFLFLEKRLNDGLLAVTIQLLDDFNEKHKGVTRINADIEAISNNTGKVYDFLVELTKDFNANQSVSKENVRMKQALDKYFQVRKLWFDGMRTEARDLLIDLVIDVGLLEKDNVIASVRLSEEIKSDADFLGKIIDGKIDDYDSADLFGSLSRLFNITLNSMPADTYISAKLNLDNYIGHDIDLEPGITDVTINLRDHTDRKLFSDESQNSSYETLGIAYEESDIFVDMDIFTPSDNARKFLGVTFKTVDGKKTAEVGQALSHLEDLGYPRNIKLLNMSESTLDSRGREFVLDSAGGFVSETISLAQDGIGEDLPLALNPAIYNQLLESQVDLFHLVEKLVNQSMDVYRDGDYEGAVTLLESAKGFLDNLGMFSRLLYHDMRIAIDLDIKEIQRDMELVDSGKPVAKAYLLRGVTNEHIVKDKNLAGDVDLQNLIDTAFAEISKIDKVLSDEIRSEMTVAIGHRPRENVPLNQSIKTIYITPQKFEVIRRMSKNQKTRALAAVVLAREISALAKNSSRFVTKSVIEALVPNRFELERYFVHTQMPVQKVSQDFSGEVITPIKQYEFNGKSLQETHVKYDKAGRPFMDLNGPRTVTTFKNGVPIKVWNSVNGKEYELPAPFEGSEFEDYSIQRAQNGNPLSVRPLSKMEKWIGTLGPMDEVFMLSKGSVKRRGRISDERVIAVVKSTPREDKIFPVVNEQDLMDYFGVDSIDDAMDSLREMVALRREKVRQKYINDELFQKSDPVTKVVSTKKHILRGAALFGGLVIPAALLLLTGCSSTPDDIQKVSKSGNYNLTPYNPDTGLDVSGVPNSALPFVQILPDGQDSQPFYDKTIAILQNTIQKAQNKLETSSDPALIRSLKRKIKNARTTLEHFLKSRKGKDAEFLETPGFSETDTGMVLPSKDWKEKLSNPVTSKKADSSVSEKGLVVPKVVDGSVNRIMMDPEHKRLRTDLSTFGRRQIIHGGKYDGVPKSYAGASKHGDYATLVKYDRIVPYDISVSIFADLLNKDNLLARKKVMFLLDQMVAERAAGFKGVIHFGYNTRGDSYISPMAPIGNTIWALKAIYGYMDISKDGSILTPENEKILAQSMQFVLDQQVLGKDDPRHGLFKAGMFSDKKDGYDVLGSKHVVRGHTVMEHQFDAHDLLNYAYRVTGKKVYRDRRELLDRSFFEPRKLSGGKTGSLFVEDGDSAYFVPAINEKGEVSSGVAIDDLTWAGSSILTMDHMSVTERLKKVRKLIKHIDNNFVVEHAMNALDAKSVILDEQYIDSHLKKATESFVGVKFFDGHFEGLNWDDPKVMSVQVEATGGYINLLYQTAMLSTDKSEQKLLMKKAKFLLDSLSKFYNTKSVVGGMPYSTRGITNVQTTLESTVASETIRALYGIFENPDMVWSFIGVSEKSYEHRVAVEPPVVDQKGFVQGGEEIENPNTKSVRVDKNKPVSSVVAADPSLTISPGNTYVVSGDIVNSSVDSSVVIHPEEATGIQHREIVVKKGVNDYITEDWTKFVRLSEDGIAFVKNMIAGSENASQDVSKWKGKFLDTPEWSIVNKDLNKVGFEQGVEYSGEIVDGRLIVKMDKSISLSKLAKLGVGQVGATYRVEVTKDKVIIRHLMSAQDSRRYEKSSKEVRSIFYDKTAKNVVFNKSDIPELKDFSEGVYDAVVGDNLENLRISVRSKNVVLNTKAVFGRNFNAPNGTRYTVKVDSNGKMVVDEKVELASIFKNPWTPNIHPEMLPKFMTGLRKSGHTRLYVNTELLVKTKNIHGLSAREYYTILIELARKEGIKVYAIQGRPDWFYGNGFSHAVGYLRAVGDAKLDFDGYVFCGCTSKT